MIFVTALFVFWRLAQIITLIPIIGMLAWFIDGYVKNNQLTPTFILVLFIVSVLAAAWALCTLFRLASTKRSAHFVSFVDLLFFGAFIASVVLLRGIAKVSCTSFNTGSIYLDLGIFGYYGYEGGANPGISIQKNCAMLKASFAFAIMNIIFFFVTSFLVFMMHRDPEIVKTEHRTTHRHHHGSRRHSAHRHATHSRSPRRSTTFV